MFTLSENTVRGSGRFEHTPRISEGSFVDVKFRFCQTTSGDGAAGVGYLLDNLLGFEKLVDLSAQGDIFLADDFLGNHFESERSVTDPSIEIVRVDSVRTGNDHSRLMGKNLGSDKKRGRGMSRPTNACTGTLGTIRSNVGQETRHCSWGLFCDV